MSYMLASIGQKESLMSSISAGKYQELNVSYCDASNQQFRVFQTYDGTRFIYATPGSSSSTSSVGSIVPMKLIPVPHKNTPNKGTKLNSSISNNRNFNCDEMLQHPRGHGQGQMHFNVEVDQINNRPQPNYSSVNSNSHYKYNQNQNYSDSNPNGTSSSSLTYFGHCVNPELKKLGLKIMSPNSRSRSWGNNSHGNSSEQNQPSSPSSSSPIKIFGMHNYFVDYHTSSDGRPGPERQRDSGDGARVKNNYVKNIHQDNNYNYNSFGGGNHIVQNQNVRLQGPGPNPNQYANTENYNLQNSNVATYVLRPVLVHPMPQHELEDVEYLPYVSMPKECVQPECETVKYKKNNTSEDAVDPGLKTSDRTSKNFKPTSSSKPGQQNGESEHQANSEDPPLEFEFLASSYAETITEILTRPNTRSEAQNQEEVKNRLLHFLTSTTKKQSGSHADINTPKSEQYQKQNQQATTQNPSTNSSPFTAPSSPSITTKVTSTGTRPKPNANSVSELFRYPSRIPYEDPIPAPASSTSGKLSPKSNISNKTHMPLQRPSTYNVHNAETPLKLKEKAKARSDITMPALISSTHTNQSLVLKDNRKPAFPKSPLKPIVPIPIGVPLPHEPIKPATVGTLTDVSFDTNNNVICRNSYTIIAADSKDKGRSTSFSNCRNSRTDNYSLRNLASSEIHCMDHPSEDRQRPEIQSVINNNVNNNFSCYFDWKQMCENESWSFFGKQSEVELPAPAEAELKLALAAASTKGHQTPPWLFDVNIDLDIIHAFNLYEEKYANYWLLYPRSFFVRSNVGINPSLCQKLTKLSLPRVATDNVLDIIGKTTPHLKYLDVSGSPGVSNEGIQKLFFKTAKENTSLHTISSWMCKNKSKMNKAANTLDYLDFSYTKTNFCSRKLINLLPGSYVCQRSFRVGENDTFGHHIFLRRIPDLEQHLQTFEKASTFEIQLGVAAGLRGAVHFMKLVEQHAWRNCYLAIRDADKHKNIPVKTKRPIIGIITATKDEKRIFGEVYFEGGDLTKVYSLFPIEMNIIGEHCPSLRSLTAVLTNTYWQRSSSNKGHFLPHLTYLNTIAEPETILSILKNCPSLKYCRARVRDGTLTHSGIINCFLTSSGTIRPCRKLQELWLVPSFMSPSRRRIIQRKERTGTGAGIISHNNLHKTQTPSIITGDSVHLIDGIELQRPQQEQEEGAQHDVRDNEAGIGILDSSLKLSAETARALFLKCPRLQRLGNMAWWSLVSKADFDDLKAELGANENDAEKTEIFIEWENILLPDLDLTSIYGPGSVLGSS